MERSSIMRGIAAAGAAALLGAIFLIHQTVTVQAAPSAGPHRCFSAQLAIRPMNKGLGAALGHTGRWYRMHVLRGGPCTLRGFPHVVLLDRNFHPVSSHVGHSGYIIPPTLPVRRVILDGRHDAYFALEEQDIPGDNGPCPQVPYLLVTPPGDRLPIVTHGGITLCPGPDDTSPVEPTPALR